MISEKKSKLYLVPVTLGETDIQRVIPDYNMNIIKGLKYFIVENIRSARRFLKSVDKEIDINELIFFELNKHTNTEIISTFIQPISEGNDVGIISESGCPAIADPGCDIVALAQQKNIDVVPLVGPTSIILSLMASGFNGQQFTFNGYLPIDEKDRKTKISKLESRIYNNNETQIFIETPFRNKKLMSELQKYCSPQTKLCIACNISCEDEMIKTKTIKEWQKHNIEIQKKNCIFLLYK